MLYDTAAKCCLSSSDGLLKYKPVAFHSSELGSLYPYAIGRYDPGLSICKQGEFLTALFI